jgi:hypothetical protein
MNITNLSTYKDNVMHVLDPSRLGGTIVDFEDSFRMFEKELPKYQDQLSM